MTIAKNTNKAKQVLANARDIRCFSLNNNFSGAPLTEQPTVWAGPVVQGHYTQRVALSQQDSRPSRCDGCFSAPLRGRKAGQR
jgi:hypothetical protein